MSESECTYTTAAGQFFGYNINLLGDWRNRYHVGDEIVGRSGGAYTIFRVSFLTIGAPYTIIDAHLTGERK